MEGITAEKVHEYVHNYILPNIATDLIDSNMGEWDNNNEEVQSISKEELLAHYTKVGLSTVL